MARASPHLRATEVRYELPTGDRLATYFIATDGKLKEFILNGPAAEPYMPVRERRAFIEQMMEVAAPSSSRAERAWGARQLDSSWREWLRPLQVGEYVFGGMIVSSANGTHDHFKITAADIETTGLKYRPQPKSLGLLSTRFSCSSHARLRCRRTSAFARRSNVGTVTRSD
ncbi:hypothetical protein C7I55_25875 [Sphingomonas deserti]|uniref:Uncharacterized protein n=1 Tax=Allosphingosinicella deserti TaxID=2116704 RepID=A0A2P7QEV7_9SPHN|nr:hypothetical protein C7I55_25875 [Sphingomonas deserti]